jgi:tRNA-Thr(GGU) m(6)t(6)A37 methyltransferase TsaA
MNGAFEITPIARIRSDFPDKFGIPRQSGLVQELQAQIIFEPAFRNADALRGLEDYSHLWLIWQFSKAVRSTWSPTVRPPRLGGNTRMGVFATRSPYRPNPLGLSCVRLESIAYTDDGPVLTVSGADLLDGTPIYDIKPYLPHIDAHPDARGGFAKDYADYGLTVHCPEELLAQMPEAKRPALLGVLRQDPRPSYQSDPDRLYGLRFAGFEIKFTVADNVLTVRDVYPES